MKYILLVVTMLFVTLAHAVDYRDLNKIGFDKLSDADKIAIMKTVTEKRDAATGTIPTTPDQIEQWVQLGANVGKGLAGAAKELGVAANEFVNTPVGKLTAFLIVWHFVGAMAIHIAGGLMVLIVGFSALGWYTHNARHVTATYSPTERDWVGRARKVAYVRTALQDGDQWILVWGSVVTIGISLTTMFSF